MTASRTPDSIVFDAEPLIAYFADEPGSETVEEHLDAVERGTDGYCSAVTLAEIHYIVQTIEGEHRADTVVEVLAESGIRRVDTSDTWRRAADFMARYSPSLGDAFALATADFVGATLVADADGDFDSIDDVEIIRVRDDGV